MATRISRDPFTARSIPRINFIIDTGDDLPTTIIISDFLFYLEASFEEYCRLRFGLPSFTGFEVNHLSTGSIIGEITAKFVESLTFAELREIIGGFFPWLSDAVMLCVGGREKEAPRSSVGLLGTIQNSILIGSVVNVTLTIEGRTISPSVLEINEGTFKGIEVPATALLEYKKSFYESEFDATRSVVIFRINHNWYAKFENAEFLVPLIITHSTSIKININGDTVTNLQDISDILEVDVDGDMLYDTKVYPRGFHCASVSSK